MSDDVKEILWRTWDANGFEHMHVVPLSDDTIRIESRLSAIENIPYQLDYHVIVTPQFVVRSFDINVPHKFSVAMSSDGNGNWRSADGKQLPAFDGCIDIDITATPFTNTLPIRRLGLKPGESADIKVVYVRVFEHTLKPVTQRYTCITPHLYRFEMPSIDFTVEIPVDDDGFVLDYPELFRRVWPRPVGTLREAPQHNIIS